MEETQACHTQSVTVSSGSTPVPPLSSAALRLEFCSADEIAACLEKFQGYILGVVAFGAPLSAEQTAAYPSLTWVDIPVVCGGDTHFEVWISSMPVTVCSNAPLVAAQNDEVVYGCITLHQSADDTLEATTLRAYTQIFDFVDRLDYPNLLRMWNYFPRINDIENGLERYRSFNVGRHEAFITKGRAIEDDTVPAACALGSSSGPLIIYFLASRQAGQPVENPRQTRAYNYPDVYGPRSPKFARAMLASLGCQQYFFISGTASILGHETVHPGDIVKQTRETLVNIQTLLEQAQLTNERSPQAQLFLKIYLRHAANHARVKEIIATEFNAQIANVQVQAVYLQSSICRTDLLLEIEGVYCKKN